MAKKDAPKGYSRGQWTKEAVRVLEERYLMKDSRGKIIETPDGMAYRVAREVAAAEKIFGADEKKREQVTREFYELICRRLFMPNSPTLMNAGKGNNLQYSGCYVLPVGDSLAEIFDAIKNTAIVHQSGGGTGFSFSSLRPKGSRVKSTHGVASGAVSFMRVFDAATNEVKQGGARRGANMGVLRVDHPDIEEFVESKLKGGITNFNISVAVTDVFMRAVEKDKDYWLYDPYLKRKTKKLKAREVFGRIVKGAWANGDPGVIFIDRVNAGPANPVPAMGPVAATNPCGEQPLYPNEACNLGSINLSLMVKKGIKEVDWEKLDQVTRTATRFLDDVIEVNPYPLPEIDKIVKANRRVGLGVMGWADLLFQLEIPYDSREAVGLAKKVMKFIQKKAHEESGKMALERGEFPNFKKSVYKDGKPLRNATLTTIAPTGSISIVAGASSGIEPLFALAYKHKVDDRELYFFNPYFEEAAKKHGLDKDIIEKVKTRGNLHGLEVPKKLARVFVTAHEVEWRGHINTQAAFQAGVDNAVSKTINLPNEAEVATVEKAYLYAYKKGCMGITVYRDRCREEQVLYAGEDKKKAATEGQRELKVKPRPAVAIGKTYRIETPVGTAFVTVNTNGKNDPFEVFVNVGKVGSDIAADAEAIGRLISLNLRLGSDFSWTEVLAQIIEQLEGIGGGESVGFGPNRIRSLADGVAKILKEYLGGQQASVSQIGAQPNLLERVRRRGHRDMCPSCGMSALIFEEGCAKCSYCGYNKC